MSRRGDLMIGPGGVAKRPRSESREIDRVWDRLENMRFNDLSPHNRNMVVEAMEILKSLRNQVSRGYHANPYTPFKIVGVLGTDVHSIAYKHAEDGKLYQHDFQRRSAEVLAVERHGKRDLLITSPEGIPLWDEF